MSSGCIAYFDAELVASKICDFIRARVGGRGAVVGLSGGIDSAVTAALSARGLGREKVLGLVMPDSAATPDEDVKDAKAMAESIGIRYRTIDITQASKLITELASAGCEFKDKVAEGNVRARLRMTILYYVANSEGRIVIGSGDKSELMIGYFTKYGDGGVDLLPLGCLYKTQVRELARHLGIPRKIVEKESSPRLWKGQTAESELGISYEDIDLILYRFLDLRMSKEDVARDLGPNYAAKVEKVVRMVRESAHKRRMPPVPKITPSSTGRGGITSG
ncbi:MAG: NAD synthetase [Candidatus Methanosuratincola subterraneus]|uniref:NH(3)-dependent NAD(+) synthetase n=1 Tax=Methanosuratincola subterraneus TaxID=2593994 RepID=A0A444L8D0_METS7|nr:MAG: NAD synthetase [Candidatus Methanosuratincola subterraneus]